MTQRRVRLLDLDKIVDAAIELIAERGRFTMPELATRLGVSVSSIYHHVSGRAALVERIRERVTAPVHSADLDEHDWERAVAAWLANCREAFARHPELVGLLTGPQSSAPAISKCHDRLIAALRNAGFPVAQVQLWIVVLDYYGFGAALDLAAELLNPGVGGRRADSDVQPETAPESLIGRGRERVDLAFELGVRAMIDGMRIALANQSS